MRTVDGISRSLGEPQASIVVLSGPNPEVVVTLAWDISWYQYRVSPDATQPVRLAERGLEPGELDEKFTEWNAHFEPGLGFSRISRIPSRPGRLHPYDEYGWGGK